MVFKGPLAFYLAEYEAELLEVRRQKMEQAQAIIHGVLAGEVLTETDSRAVNVLIDETEWIDSELDHLRNPERYAAQAEQAAIDQRRIKAEQESGYARRVRTFVRSRCPVATSIPAVAAPSERIDCSLSSYDPPWLWSWNGGDAFVPFSEMSLTPTRFSGYQR